MGILGIVGMHCGVYFIGRARLPSWRFLRGFRAPLSYVSVFHEQGERRVKLPADTNNRACNHLSCCGGGWGGCTVAAESEGGQGIVEAVLIPRCASGIKSGTAHDTETKAEWMILRQDLTARSTFK